MDRPNLAGPIRDLDSETVGAVLRRAGVGYVTIATRVGCSTQSIHSAIHRVKGRVSADLAERIWCAIEDALAATRADRVAIA